MYRVLYKLPGKPAVNAQFNFKELKHVDEALSATGVTINTVEFIYVHHEMGGQVIEVLAHENSAPAKNVVQMKPRVRLPATEPVYTPKPIYSGFYRAVEAQ